MCVIILFLFFKSNQNTGKKKSFLPCFDLEMLPFFEVSMLTSTGYDANNVGMLGVTTGQ